LDRGKTIELLGSELTDDGLKLKGEAFTLITADVDTWESGGVEGQCLVKHGDYIYMFYSGNGCCGPRCNYQIGVARAPSIHGPWERYDGNPIMHGGGQWRCPGHGTLVTTTEGRHFFLYHAYNTATNVYTGRQGLMDEIVWDATTGWPSFRYGTIPSIQAATPYEGIVQQNVQDFSDKFDAADLGVEWIYDASLDRPSYQIKDGKLMLAGNNLPTGSFFGLRPRKDSYTFQATVEKGASPAGICIYGNKDNIIGLSQINNRVELWQVERGVRMALATEELPQNEKTTVLFFETRFGQYCRFGFLKENIQQQVGTLLHIRGLPQWDRPPMTGIIAGGNGTGLFEEVSISYE